MSERRPATHLEAKALSHPLRVRLLTLLTGQGAGISELARRTGMNPGTVLHHLRVLVDAGLVEAGLARPGLRNSREVPYLATGRTVEISFREESDSGASVSEAILEGALASYYAAPVADRFGESVATMRLSAARQEQFQRELRDLVSRFNDEEGAAVEMLVAFHRAGSDAVTN